MNNILPKKSHFSNIFLFCHEKSFRFRYGNKIKK